MANKTTLISTTIAVLFLAGLAGTMSNAHPKFAVREAVTCVQCHVNNQGGGLRNEYGANYYSRDVLPAIPWDDFGNENFTTAINEFIRYGSDVRMQFYNYSEQNSSQNAFFPMQADVYLGVTPSDQFTVYFEQSLFRSIASTDLWAQWSNSGGNVYVRFGQFFQDYGLRLDDHTSFIRGGNDGGVVVNENTAQIPVQFQGLHWKPENNNVGFEAGYNPIGWKITGSIGKKLGQETYSTSINASRAFWIGPANMLFGLSYFNGGYYRQLDRYSYYGAYAGLNWGPLTLMGEADLMRDYPAANATGFTAYADLTWQIQDGVFLALEQDYFDANRDLENNELVRYTIGAELFPISYVEVKPQYRLLNATASPDFSRSEFILQFHFWF
ncbi:MAG TPA: hypothetical protein VKA68_11280 [bacterium]|nr:hypothetical protein [bacterium]